MKRAMDGKPRSLKLNEAELFGPKWDNCHNITLRGKKPHVEWYAQHNTV